MQLAAMTAIAATLSGPLACPPAAGPQTASLRPSLAACSAAPPVRGESFSGTVLQVIDGQTLCVARGPTADQWVRVRLTDAGAANPRGALMAAAFAKAVVCVAAAAEAEGVAGVCIANGRSVGRAAAEPDATAQAADWR